MGKLQGSVTMASTMMQSVIIQQLGFESEPQCCKCNEDYCINSLVDAAWANLTAGGTKDVRIADVQGTRESITQQIRQARVPRGCRSNLSVFFLALWTTHGPIDEALQDIASNAV